MLQKLGKNRPMLTLDNVSSVLDVERTTVTLENNWVKHTYHFYFEEETKQKQKRGEVRWDFIRIIFFRKYFGLPSTNFF
jgi:hypothetical protein